MKRLILASIVAMSFFAAEAQTTKKAKSKKAKKTNVSSEAKMKSKQKAEISRIKKETDVKIAEYRMASYQTDSMRIDSERVARENFEIERQTYLDTRYKEIDSTNQAKWKKYGEDKEQFSKTDQHLDAVNRAANLSSYEGKQVKAINQIYFDKARIVKDNVEITDEQRKQELQALNMERRAKIKAVVGKSKDKKIEKERKEYAKKYGEDSQAKWIDEVEGIAINK